MIAVTPPRNTGDEAPAPMPKPWDDVPTRTLAYMGRRRDGDKLKNVFVALDADGEPDHTQEHWYKANARTDMIIGAIYYAPITDEGTTWFAAWERVGDMDEETCMRWSLADQAARNEKADRDSRKRLIKERRDLWRECLAPIREHYLQANAAERRAIRNLLVDDLLRAK